MTIPQPLGHVAIVGAGPGDPELITRKGLAFLKQADVVVYDRLVAPALLGETPLDARRICAAKKRGSHRLSQRAIEEILIDEARGGRQVVRLKGGDPFVFGRGGEEALALKRAGIPFSIVPGVTSAVAVPAYAGIPLTHRGLSAAFSVWSGHAADGSSIQNADAPTQVILMGTTTLRATVDAVMAGGRPPSTPAAIISWGTTGKQQTLVTSLGELAQRAEQHGVASPAAIVVGEVAALSEELDWFDPPRGPWSGRVAAFAQPTHPGDPALERWRALGADVATLPIVRGESPTWPGPAGWAEAVIQCIADMLEESMIDAVVFPDAARLDAFAASREKLGDRRALDLIMPNAYLASDAAQTS